MFTTMACVLVIEDDAAIRRGVEDALAFAGHEVLSAGDGNTGLRRALEANYALLLLDLMLPGLSGFDILAALREKRPGQPVIILSARGEEADRVRGLRMGADDYVVKPFSVRELLARVEAVLRRSTERPAPIASWSFPGGQVDITRREVCHEDGSREDLAAREVELLQYLIAARGRPVPRDELLRQVWKIDPSKFETRTVDMHIANLRHKLRDTGQTMLRTLRGHGWVLEEQPPAGEIH
jgi:DNA-binding response OmpR family regulator